MIPQDACASAPLRASDQQAMHDGVGRETPHASLMHRTCQSDAQGRTGALFDHAHRLQRTGATTREHGVSQRHTVSAWKGCAASHNRIRMLDAARRSAVAPASDHLAWRVDRLFAPTQRQNRCGGRSALSVVRIWRWSTCVQAVHGGMHPGVLRDPLLRRRNAGGAERHPIVQPGPLVRRHRPVLQRLPQTALIITGSFDAERRCPPRRWSVVPPRMFNDAESVSEPGIAWGARFGSGRALPRPAPVAPSDGNAVCAVAPRAYRN